MTVGITSLFIIDTPWIAISTNCILENDEECEWWCCKREPDDGDGGGSRCLTGDLGVWSIANTT